MSSDNFDYFEERQRKIKAQFERDKKTRMYMIGAIILSLLSILISILKFAIRHL